MKIRYKVLRRGKYNVLVSCFAYISTLCLTEYFPGEWTTVNPDLAEIGFYLTVFNTVESAQDFVTYDSCYELWEIQVEELKDLPSFRPVHPPFSIEEFRIGAEEDYWPIGTEMCKRVKLLKQLDVPGFKSPDG